MYNNKQIDFHTNLNNISIINIINFVLWINYIYILYIKYNFEYVNGLLDYIENEELLTEFISRKNDLTNVALLINNAFENINIIINFLSLYKFIYDDYYKKHPSSPSISSTNSIPNIQITEEEQKYYYNKIVFSNNKFCLYNLFNKIIEKEYTSKLDEKISKIFKTSSTEYFEELFTIKEEKENDKENKNGKKNGMDLDGDDEYLNQIKAEDDDCDCDDYSDYSDISLNAKPTKKEIIENFMNSMVDRYINGNNSNGIMHTYFIMDKSYIDNYENVLIDIFSQKLKKCIEKNNMSLNECFDIVEKITRCEGNSKSLFMNRDSLGIIRRTKMRLMIEGYKTIFQYLQIILLKDFKERVEKGKQTEKNKLYLSISEKIKFQDYDLNMDALSEIGEANIRKNIKEETANIVSFLKESACIDKSDQYLADEYIKLKIDNVILLKKILLNYYKQIEIYKERNEKVEYFIKNKYKFVEGKKCYEKINNDDNKNPYQLSEFNNDKIIIK